MIFEVISGLTILDEAPIYSTSHLIGISIGVVITVIGILVLGNKKTLIARDGEKKLLKESAGLIETEEGDNLAESTKSLVEGLD